MSIIQSISLLAGEDGYNISRSLRFRSSASAYLNRTPASAGNQKTWTWSGWVKRGSLGGAMVLFAARTGVGASYSIFRFGIDTLVFEDNTITSLTSAAVFRDASSWYHIVFSVDTTQATQTERTIIYINGVRNSFATGSFPVQNANLQINSTQTHLIGQQASAQYLDGYLTEVNFIDGQALTPSSFGETDVLTGVWKPKKYAGTYGTNGFYLPFKNESAATYAGFFNGSNKYLSVAQNSAFSFGTGDFTIESWVNANAWNSVNPIIALGDGAVGGGSPVYSGWAVRYDSSGSLIFFRYDGVETTPNVSLTLPTNKWHHIAVSRTSGVLKMFVNGAQVYSASNTTSYDNVNSNTLKIGGGWVIGGGVTTYVNGYISNVRIVKGAGLYTASFTPSLSSLTAVSGTSLLALQNATIVDNSTNAFSITNNNSVATSIEYPFIPNIASDQSGNGNSWTTNNISLVNGTTYDSMVDVPTMSALGSNYCVANPLAILGNSNVSITNGNLDCTIGVAGQWRSTQASTMTLPSGKWYFEVTQNNATSGGDCAIGILQNGASYTGNFYFWNNAYGFAYINDGTKGNNNGVSAYGASWTSAGDVIGVAVDITAGTLTFYKNNVSQGSAYTFDTTREYFVALAGASSTPQYSINFGQRPFSYTPPTGFVALNTFNLLEPSIKAGNKHFDILTHTGNGASNRSITGYSFDPDFVWVKDRTGANSHVLINNVVGGTKQLFSNLTNAEQTNTDVTNGFTTGGFIVGSNVTGTGATNLNGNAYVDWAWKANGTGATNTAGSITSTVSANPTAGFSVVTYTGTGANATVGHGLGVAPKMIIVKNRPSSVDNWWVYHSNLTSPAYRLRLNTTDAQDSQPTGWNSTAPTSSVFSIGSSSGTNGVSNSMIAYCFSEVAGYSKFGSYTGNGSTDGPFVHLGFRPKFVMLKRTDSTSDWVIQDASRSTTNVAQLYLNANTSDAEQAFGFHDLLSNGFKLRQTNGTWNVNGATYIYMAFAENPFKYSLAR